MKYSLCCLNLCLLGLFLFIGTSKGQNDQSITYGGKYYFIEGVARENWFDAWSKCNEKGMRLLCINSEGEKNFLRTTVQSKPGIGPNFRFWTAGITAGNNIYCIDQGQTSTYTNWRDGEPDGGLGSCVLVTYNIYQADLTCENLCRYICEGDVTPP